MLSKTQADSGRTAKEEQERISPNHVQTIFHFSVFEGSTKIVNLAKVARPVGMNGELIRKKSLDGYPRSS